MQKNIPKLFFEDFVQTKAILYIKKLRQEEEKTKTNMICSVIITIDYGVNIF